MRQRLAIKLSTTPHPTTCALCPRVVPPAEVQLVTDRGNEPVCPACGQDRAPALVRLLALARQQAARDEWDSVNEELSRAALRREAPSAELVQRFLNTPVLLPATEARP